MSTVPDGARPPSRVLIEKVLPCVDGGKTPVKRVQGDVLQVKAVAFCDGHDLVKARLFHRARGRKAWNKARMVFQGNDVYAGSFELSELTDYEYTVEACLDPFASWLSDFKKKLAADQAGDVDLRIGATVLRNYRRGLRKTDKDLIDEKISALEGWTPDQLTLAALDLWYADRLQVLTDEYFDPESLVREKTIYRCQVDDRLAAFSAWYEFFPRSTGENGRHGTFATSLKMLDYIAKLGFDVVYLPPVHPIGKKFRKGRNNSLLGAPGDVGSPWAIGSDDGGHKSLHPDLGSWKDFEIFVQRARALGLEVALDIAIQCSPDHPYLKEHPDWFKKRPDGSIQYAENPPKKYQDIYPFDFESADWKNLWKELLSVFQFWLEKDVRLFRVDNPHTKPFHFWKWCLAELRAQYPKVILLSEAFTRPHPMNRLAKDGFQQSYTYFTWRHGKRELQDYLMQLTQTDQAEYFRPNFWPNTPDILTPELQAGNRATFMQRLVLAATLSPNYGIYGPAFELLERDARRDAEEYVDNEKYQLRHWDLTAAHSLAPVIEKLNEIRRAQPALQALRPLLFLETENEQLIAYAKHNAEAGNLIVTVVNLDSQYKQSGFLHLPLEGWLAEGDGRIEDYRFEMHDLLNDARYVWRGRRNYVELDPAKTSAHIFKLSTLQEA